MRGHDGFRGPALGPSGADASELNVGAKAGSRAGQPVTMRAEPRVGERGHGGSSLAPNRWRTENRIAIDGVSIRARRQSTTWEMRPGMLRLLHTADVHLGARHADMGEQATAQRERQFDAFRATVDLALAEKVDLLLIAGDLFDSNTKELLWRGSASGTVSNKSDSNIKNLDKGVQKMFKNYPPKA